jgi:hypothetical protein
MLHGEDRDSLASPSFSLDGPRGTQQYGLFVALIVSLLRAGAGTQLSGNPARPIRI